MQKLQNERRIEIVESKRIDARNSLALVRCDDKEYFLLIGATQNVVLDSEVRVKK